MERFEVAIIRCLSDLIKADKIIAEKEINFFEQSFNEISKALSSIEKARNISLQNAIEILQTLPTKKREALIEKFKKLSLSDGACSREEALLILAMAYCLGNKTKENCKIVSVATPQIDFEDSQVLYIEPREDKNINNLINDNHKVLINDFRIGGFDFIYIPQIAEHYSKTDKLILKKIIHYLAPTLSNNETEKVRLELASMTTRYFYNVIIKKRQGLDINITSPAILIKIGNSYVSGIKTSDFLVVKIDKSFCLKVRQLIDDFLSFQCNPIITIKNYTQSPGNFVYTGFYKTIFDLVTLRETQRNTLTFRYKNCDIIIDGDPSKTLRMSPAETAIYQFIILQSLSENKGFSVSKIGRHGLDMLQNSFIDLYKKYKGAHPARVPIITDRSTLNPYISKIRKAINECTYLSDKNLYLPTVVKIDTNDKSAKTVYVSIDGELVYEQ